MLNHSSNWENFKKEYFSHSVKEKSDIDMLKEVSLSEIPYNFWENFLMLCDDHDIHLIYPDLDPFALIEFLKYVKDINILRRFSRKEYKKEIENLFRSNEVNEAIFNILCYDPLDFDFLLMSNFYKKRYITRRTYLAISLINNYKLEVISSRKDKCLEMEYKVLIGCINSKGFLTRKDVNLLNSGIFERIEVFDNAGQFVNINYQDLIISTSTLGWKVIGVL